MENNNNNNNNNNSHVRKAVCKFSLLQFQHGSFSGILLSEILPSVILKTHYFSVKFLQWL